MFRQSLLLIRAFREKKQKGQKNWQIKESIKQFLHDPFINQTDSVLTESMIQAQLLTDQWRGRLSVKDHYMKDKNE